MPLTASDLAAISGTMPNEINMDKERVLDYSGNKVYEDGSLKMILLGSAYYDTNENNYYFYIQDHLGNNRIVADAGGAVVQSNQYYPFGIEMETGDFVQQTSQPYKYNNKELDSQNNLNWYDYSARWKADWYFPTQDPLSEEYYSISPYAYVANNPIKFLDPTGMYYTDYTDKDGNIIYRDDDGSTNVVVINPLPEVTVTGSKKQNPWYQNTFLIGLRNIISGGAIDRANRELEFDNNNPSLSEWIAFQHGENSREIRNEFASGGYMIGAKIGNKGIKFKSKISVQKMKRHLKGTAPHNKSYFNSVNDAQSVLDAYNSGNCRIISFDPQKNSVTIEVNNITGRYVNIDNPNGLPNLDVPTNKFMIQSGESPKVVPVNPNK